MAGAFLCFCSLFDHLESLLCTSRFYGSFSHTLCAACYHRTNTSDHLESFEDKDDLLLNLYPSVSSCSFKIINCLIVLKVPAALSALWLHIVLPPSQVGLSTSFNLCHSSPSTHTVIELRKSVLGRLRWVRPEVFISSRKRHKFVGKALCLTGGVFFFLNINICTIWKTSACLCSLLYWYGARMEPQGWKQCHFL